MKTYQTRPYMLGNEEGLLIQALGTSTSIKATSDQTGGIFNLFEVACPLHYATPLHIHYTEDVAVYILEGTLTFYWGSEQKVALAGSFFYQPRGIPHGFRVNCGSPARILYITVPAGFDQFIINQGFVDPESNPEVNAAEYKIEVLGPLPV